MEVSPRQAGEVQAPRDGVIKEIYAWPGDEIGSGAPLLRLDDTALRERKMALQNERNEYTGHLRRIEKLVEKELVKPEIWDNNLQKLAQIRAELAIIEEKLEDSIVRAPLRGTVIWSDLKTGQEVKGAEPIYWIGDGEQLWLSGYLEEEYTTGLKKDDIVAIFLDETSSPVLGKIDFISFGGPKGGNVNIYVNAPRVGEIAAKDTHQVLIPIPADEDILILPEEVLNKDGSIFQLVPLGSEPDKYFVSLTKPVITQHEGGVIHVKNIKATIPVIMNPPDDMKHRDIVKAYMTDKGWSEAYATAILKKENTSKCAEGNVKGMGVGGSCGGGTGTCGNGQGVQEPIDTEHPEKNVCLVPADMFEEVELDLPPIVKPDLSMFPELPEAQPIDMKNLPATLPE